MQKIKQFNGCNMSVNGRNINGQSSTESVLSYAYCTVKEREVQYGKR